MTVRCPRCHSEQSLPAAEAGARGGYARCSVCDTRWLARPYEGLLPLAEKGNAIADAIVIEDRTVQDRLRLPPPPPAGRLPPRWRRPHIDRRLKALGVVAGVIVALIVLGTPIVSALPEMNRPPFDAGQLEFRKVRSETVSMRGVSTLFVEGEIVNRAAGHVELPVVLITLKSPDGTPVASWSVEPAVDSLAAGRSIGFRSALVSPPPDAAQVTLNLAERQGLAGLR
jgi:predicted Zn finger-like uncharacterized protein